MTTDLNIIALGDLHVRPSKLEPTIRTLEYALELATTFGSDLIVLNGDVVHTHSSVHSRSYYTIYDTLRQSPARVLVNSGNHDQPFGDSRSIIAPMNRPPDVEVIEDFMLFNEKGIQIGILPYGVDGSTLQDLQSPSILFAHDAVTGAVVGPEDFEYIAGRALSSFPDATLRVFSHFHKRQLLDDHSLYIGSAYQVTYAEAWEDKGIIRITMDTSGEYDLEYCYPPNLPKYFDFHVDSKKDLKAVEDVIEGNCVKVTSSISIPKKTVDNLRERAYGHAFSYLYVKPEGKRENDIAIDTANFHLDASVRTYIRSHVPKDLQKDALDIFDKAVEAVGVEVAKPGNVDFYSVHLHNFGPHEDTFIRLNEYDILLLLGALVQSGETLDVSDLLAVSESSNGAGKSWIVNAIIWVLTGHLPYGPKTGKDKVIRSGEKECYVEVTGNIRGHDVRILRGRPTRLEIDIEGTPPPKSKDLEAYLKDTLLCLPEALLTGLILMGQRRSKLRYYLDLESREQRDVLDSVLGVTYLKPWLESVLSEYTVMKEQLDEYQAQLDILQVDRLTYVLEQAEADYTEWEQHTEKEALERATKIEEIQQQLSRVKKELDGLSIERRDAVGSLAGYAWEYEDIRSQLPEIEAALQEWETFREEQQRIASTENALKRVGESKIRVLQEQQAQEDPHCPECNQFVSQEHISSELDRFQEDCRVHGSAAEEADGQIRSAAENISNLRAYQNSADILQQKIQTASSAEQRVAYEIKNKQLSIQNLDRELRTHSSAHIEVNPHKKRLDLAVSDLDTVLNRQEEIEVLLEPVSLRVSAALEVLSALGYRTGKGVRMSVYAAFQPQINKLLLQYSTKLSGGLYALQISLVKPDKDGGYKDNFDLRVVFPNGNMDTDRSSGGQNQRMNLATMFAFRDLYSSICGVTSNLLGIDEAFDGLDGAGRQALAQLLQQLRENIKNMLVISHDPVLQQMFPHKALILNEGGFRARVVLGDDTSN